MSEAAGTHALVIGTSDYKYLDETKKIVVGRQTFGLTKVKSCAVGAYQFATWLKNEYNCPTAPLQSIRLLAAPSELEIQKAPELKNVEISNTANVRKALLSWWKQCASHPNNVAIFYASGHGLQTNRDQYYVLLEDFAEDELTLSFAIDVKAVFDGMIGASMANKQFFFIDACRANVTSYVDQSFGAGLGLPRQFNGPDDRLAPIICSAAPGRLALAEPGEPPIFSKALLASLRDPAAYVSGLGNVKTMSYFTLVDSVQSKVEALAQGYSAEQCLVLGGLARNTTFQVLSEQRLPTPEVKIQMEPMAIHSEVTALGALDEVVKTFDEHVSLSDNKVNRIENTLEGPIKFGLRIIQNSEFLQYRMNEKLIQSAADVAGVKVRKGATKNLNEEGGWWWWSLSIEGSDEKLNSIKKVEYYLHESFGKEPYVRAFDRYRKTNFCLEMVGWGGFDLKAIVIFKDSDKRPVTLTHELELFFPSGTACED